MIAFKGSALKIVLTMIFFISIMMGSKYILASIPLIDKFYKTLVFFIFILLFIFSFCVSERSYSIIIVKPKKELPCFWVKNKDQIIVGLIVGIPIAIIAFLLGYFTKK
jgi:hypothetical protein